ncbi:MAG: hypothetical protein IKR45_01425 [Treponema sp.]|jgi:hypothetical protein|nr:hypothetical protein [Treponema sp.]
MADKIERISNISYDTTKVPRVRGYTKKERQKKMETIEKESQKHLEALTETRDYLAKYPTPKGVPFTDLLDQAMGISNKIPPADDDEGYVLDISHGS